MTTLLSLSERDSAVIQIQKNQMDKSMLVETNEKIKDENISDIVKNQKFKKMSCVTEKNWELLLAKYLENQLNEVKEESNLDMKFFESLMPDFNKLSESMKRKFKMIVMNQLNELLASEEKFSADGGKDNLQKVAAVPPGVNNDRAKNFSAVAKFFWEDFNLICFIVALIIVYPFFFK